MHQSSAVHPNRMLVFSHSSITVKARTEDCISILPPTVYHIIRVVMIHSPLLVSNYLPTLPCRSVIKKTVLVKADLPRNISIAIRFGTRHN